MRRTQTSSACVGEKFGRCGPVVVRLLHGPARRVRLRLCNVENGVNHKQIDLLVEIFLALRKHDLVKRQTILPTAIE